MTTPGEGNYISTIFLNDGDDLFTENTNLNLPVAYWGDAKAADYNNDGDVDLLITGYGATENVFTAFFRNDVISGTPTESIESFTIYPNPSSGIIYLDNLLSASSYQLFDINGRKVMEGEFALRAQIDLHELQTGFYMLKLVVDGKIYNKKIILE